MSDLCLICVEFMSVSCVQKNTGGAQMELLWTGTWLRWIEKLIPKVKRAHFDGLGALARISWPKISELPAARNSNFKLQEDLSIWQIYGYKHEGRLQATTPWDPIAFFLSSCAKAIDNWQQQWPTIYISANYY